MKRSFSIMDERDSAELRYRLRAMPRIPVASAAPDVTVKIRGYASPVGPLVTAPMTRTPCVLYAAEWRELAPPPSSVDIQPWRTSPLRRAVGGGDFLLDDGTGRALVRLDGALVSLLGTWAVERTQPLRLGPGQPPPGEPRHGTPGRFIEHREMRVDSGALLTVLGCATFEPDTGPPAPGPRDESPYRTARRRCVLAASAASPLYIVRELIGSLEAVG